MEDAISNLLSGFTDFGGAVGNRFEKACQHHGAGPAFLRLTLQGVLDVQAQELVPVIVG